MNVQVETSVTLSPSRNRSLAMYNPFYFYQIFIIYCQDRKGESDCFVTFLVSSDVNVDVNRICHSIYEV